MKMLILVGRLIVNYFRRICQAGSKKNFSGLEPNTGNPTPSLLSSWNEVICGELKHAFSALTSNPKQKQKEKKKNGFAKNTRGIFFVQNMFQSIA